MAAGSEGLCTLKQEGKMLKGWGIRLAVQRGCCQSDTQLPMPEPACSALGLLCRAQDHLHFREYKSLSLSPEGQEVIPALSSGTTGRRPGDTQL